MPIGSRNGTRPSAIGSERRIDETSDIMTATLDVTDLRKQFAIGRPAVDGVSFAVPAGEIVVLLGPSGCGKTTTLRCVAGLEHPTDRKSTRLNSSHANISYAVFCLKKKK